MSQRTYASIGKVVLVPALGVALPYKTGYDFAIDSDCKNCKECPFIDKEGGLSEMCNGCEHLKVVSKPKYVYEEHRYGHRPKVGLASLKVLIYLHFEKDIDVFGRVHDVSISEVARAIHVTERTVRNVLHSLQGKKYIKVTPEFKGLRTIYLNDYTKYSLSAKEGGLGYVVINDSFAKKIYEMKDIKKVRFYLRSLMDIDKANGKESVDINEIHKSTNQVMREFPSYMRKGILRELIRDINQDGSVLRVEEKSDDTLSISLNQKYIGKKTRSVAVKEYEYVLEKFVNNVNKDIIALKKNADADVFYPEWRETILSFETKTPVYDFDFDFHNIACLVDWFSYEAICEALLEVIGIMNKKGYDDENSKDRIFNIGAYIRTIITNNTLVFTNKAA